MKIDDAAALIVRSPEFACVDFASMFLVVVSPRAHRRASIARRARAKMLYGFWVQPVAMDDEERAKARPGIAYVITIETDAQVPARCIEIEVSNG